MSNYKEIVTKAVIAKAKKNSSNSFTLTPENNADTILGCWVINHTFSGSKKGSNQVAINGSFDVNVWYSYENDKKTAVASQTFNYSDTVNISSVDDIDNNAEIIVRALKQPTVANVGIKDGIVSLDIEKEMGIEIIGDAKVKISVEEDDEETDEYEDIDIDENYLEKKEDES